MQSSPTKFQILVAVFVVIALFGTVGFMLIERLSFVDAFYFTLVTIATVGYGDIHPTTQAAKWFTVILIVCGVGTFGGILASARGFPETPRSVKVLPSYGFQDCNHSSISCLPQCTSFADQRSQWPVVTAR